MRGRKNYLQNGKLMFGGRFRKLFEAFFFSQSSNFRTFAAHTKNFISTKTLKRIRRKKKRENRELHKRPGAVQQFRHVTSSSFWWALKLLLNEKRNLKNYQRKIVTNLNLWEAKGKGEEGEAEIIDTN